MVTQIRNFLACIFLFGFLAVASPVQALTLTPIRLELQADPGQTFTEEVTLYNERPTTETFYISYANFEAQGESGNPAFVEPKDGIGTWMKAAEKVIIAPKSSKTVPFTVAVPADASAGGHFGAIFWGTVPQGSGAGQVSIGAKTGLLVLLSVSGPISEKGGIVDFSTIGKKTFYTALPVDFTYRFENAGSDRIKPVGLVTIRNVLGLKAKEIPGNPVDGNILPRSTRRFETSWVGKDIPNPAKPIEHSGFFNEAKYQWRNFAFGRYVAHLNLVYGFQKETTNAKFAFWVLPWQLLIIILFIAGIAFFLIRLSIRHYNNWVIGRAEELLEELQAQKKRSIVHRVLRPVKKVATKKITVKKEK
jgi:hypothetical protein